MSKTINTTEEAVAGFIEGALIHYAAIYIDDKKMAMRGLVRADESVKFLDRQGSNARDSLLPLLNHDDDGVRLTAAGAVFHSHRSLALPVIEEIADVGVTEAYITAKMMLSWRRIFGYYGMGVWDDPRFPQPERPETSM